MIVDGPDEIARCLECAQRECSNCLERMPKHIPKKRSAVNMLDAVTGQVVAYYPTITKASQATKLSTDRIRYYCETGRVWRGFSWKYHSKDGDDTHV